MPKQLIPIANRPVLEHVLADIASLGVSETAVVVGDHADEIAAALGDGSRFGMRLHYLHQARPEGLAHCVLLAREFLGEDDFVMYLGDNMLPQGVAHLAEEFRATRPDAQIVVHKVPDPRAFGVAEVDADGWVTRLVEKPAEPRSDLAMVGVYFFTAAVHAAVAAIEPSARGELEITDAVQWLVERGAAVRARVYDGYWKDTGRLDDVLACNREVLDGLTAAVRGEVDADSELLGAVVVEEGARVVRSRIEGPVVIGAGTVVTDSVLGPHTSLGRDCVVEQTRLTDSIALDGAVVTGVRGLHGSIIGRQARIGVADAVPGERHRLFVGDHTRVEVAA